MIYLAAELQIHLAAELYQDLAGSRAALGSNWQHSCILI
jgi:hypothetical protein